MNSKTIKNVLKTKFEDWVKTIDDDYVRMLVRNNTMITGGAIVSMLLKEDVKDFDVYFTDKETTLAVAKYYVNKFNESNNGKQAEVLDGEFVKGGRFNLTPDRIKILIKSSGVAAEKGGADLSQPFDDAYDAIPPDDDKKPKYRPVFLSSNAITLSDKIQLVVRFHGEPDKIHENYDFVHCTNYWTAKDNKLVLRPEALEAILSRTMVYTGSKYPLCSLIRIRKFIKRGWTITAGQMLKAMFQLSKLNLSDINVLEDQLIGVDSAYFTHLIDGLRSKQESDPSFQIESTYLAALIDKIF